MGSDKKGSGFFTKSVVVLAIAIAIPVYRTLFNSGDPISYLLPNFLLFTPYRDLTKRLWEERIKIDKNVRYAPQHIPEIDARDYTFESLRAATENWRYPAVIRGLFNNTPAQQKWVTLDYLPSRIGSYKIPVVGDATVGKLQNDRSVRRFDESFTEIITNANSKAYLFFPVKSRFNFNGSDVGSLEALQKEIDDIVVEDLQLDRIWKGFGTKAHKSFYGSQLIIGQGTDDSEATTGTGWHCAAGNNWFAQVVGTKRWYFMDPKYSALMHPLRGGKVNMMTGTRRMAEFQPHIPLRYADIRAGDLLYNPDWEWHTIRNYKGLSIGVPIREVNISLSIQNNAHYTAIVTLNRVADRFGINIGGYPPN